MTKTKLFIVFILFFSYTQTALSQSKVIEGIVVDSKTKEPLPYATVGIKNTLVGTATNSEGRFIISIPSNLMDSSLFCSYMGYKDFEIQVRSFDSKIRINMDLDTFTLDEIEIRPWQPWDYVWNAMQKIPENYAQKPYMSSGYYSEYMSENDVFLKFTEGVIETYNPAYGEDKKSQSKVLKARRGDELGTLQFMREKLQAKNGRKEIQLTKKLSQLHSVDRRKF